VSAFRRLLAGTFRDGVIAGRSIALVLLVVALILAGYAGMSLQQASIAGHLSSLLEEGESRYASPIYLIAPGTARTQIWNAINDRYLRSTPSLGGPLLPMRHTAVWMAFIVPLIALILTFDSISAELESGVFRSLLVAPIDRRAVLFGRLAGHVLTAVVTLLLGLAIGLWAIARFVSPAWTGEQIVRLILFFAVLGAYATFFSMIGLFLSATLKRSTRSMWACILLVVAVFGMHMLVENAAGMRSWDLPDAPERSAEVAQYLWHANPDRVDLAPPPPPSVLEYIDALQTHTRAVHAVVARRYAAERWMGFVSPTHWLLTMANHLLQDQYKTITDVFAGLPVEAFGTDRSSALHDLLPEVGGMVAVLVALSTVLVFVVHRLEV